MEIRGNNNKKTIDLIINKRVVIFINRSSIVCKMGLAILILACYQMSVFIALFLFSKQFLYISYCCR